MKKAAKKLGLEKAVIGGAVRGEEINDRDLELMLREGAYFHFGSNASFSVSSLNELKDMDVEEILKLKARKIKVASIRGEVSFELSHNTTGSGENEEEKEKERRNEINDPNFWMKVLPRDLTAKDLLARINSRQG